MNFQEILHQDSGWNKKVLWSFSKEINRNLTHVNTHVRTQWLFYVYEVSPHFHHYHIRAWSHPRQVSLPWWRASNMDSPSCPSRSLYTPQRTQQHLSSLKHKSSRLITDLHAALLHPRPHSIHRAVNLANCVNIWPQRSCAYTQWYFSHMPLGFTSPYYLHVALIPHYPKIWDF